MTLYIQLVATDDRCYSKSMKNGKGRIEPWQPRKRQRRKRSTKRSISKQQTGDAEASPKFFWKKIFSLCHPERSQTICVSNRNGAVEGPLPGWRCFPSCDFFRKRNTRLPGPRS